MLEDADVLGRIHWSEPVAASYLAVTLASLPIRPFVDIVCVGTDRSTGDSCPLSSALVRHQDRLLPPAYARTEPFTSRCTPEPSGP